MTYFATCFALNLVGLRFRIRIDLDDEPEIHTPDQRIRVCEPAQRSKAASN